MFKIMAIINLRNLTQQLPFSRRVFSIKLKGVHSQEKDNFNEKNICGFGQLVFGAKGVQRTVIGIFYFKDQWFICRNSDAIPLDEAEIFWKCRKFIPGFIEIAALSFSYKDKIFETNYFRPTFRHVFEGGWGLNDVDMGFLIAQAAKNDAVRSRLLEAINNAQSN